MRVTEVRIGNYLTGQDGHYIEHVVIGISGNTIITQPVGVASWVSTEPISKIDGHSSAKPISLTDDWILRLGFIGNELEVKPNIDLFYRENKMLLVVEACYAFLPDIQYVHQLQNLYFSLTGEELTISLSDQ